MNKGDIIGGRYRLDREIGQGGTGRIWLAQDSRLDRGVAIKFLFAHTAAQQARLARRVSLEAKIAASIQHRNVIQIFDFGTHEANVPFIVMEALSGFTLGEAFDGTQSFSIDTLIHIVSEVLRGLSAVHDAGIVHRDLKPENIFLVKEPRGKLSPKLLDFGISRSLEPETRPSAVTTTEGVIVGTPQYMSPEQARGHRHIDKRTDIYSIGTIMFEAFAGTVPFSADSISELLVAVITRNAPPLFDLVPQIGPAMCAVVDKALASGRERRYEHAADMLDAVVAAALEIPAELDRRAALFPPAGVRNRGRQRYTHATTGELTADSSDFKASSATPETVDGQRIRRKPEHKPSERAPSPEPLPSAGPLTAAAAMSPRLQFAPPRALWIALAAFAALGVSLPLGVMLLNRSEEPEGSGLIVVQAPSATQVATQHAQTPPTRPAVIEVEEATLIDRPDAPPKKVAAIKAKKHVATDPMQLMAASVAEAFSRQKAGVVACLTEHAADVEGAAQLEVRLVIDRSGVASDATLLPAAIASKPVAGCLRAAVTSMSFPRPDQPTTFRVPLSWRRK